MKKLSSDEILQSVGVLSVVASLIFVGLELRQGNLLAKMEASDRAYQGSTASREMQLLYTREWLEGATNNQEISNETISDERFRLMCSNVIFNLSNNWEQDALSDNPDKMNYLNHELYTSHLPQYYKRACADKHELYFHAEYHLAVESFL